MKYCPPTTLLPILVLASLLALLAGCAADHTMDDGCDYDTDCRSDEYCIDAQCTLECTHDEECRSGTYCEVFQREGDVDPIQACLDANDAENGGVECESDQDCRDALGDDNARCGIHDRCVLTPANGANQNQNQAPQNEAKQNHHQNGNQEPEQHSFHLVVVEQLGDDGLPVSLSEEGSGLAEREKEKENEEEDKNQEEEQNQEEYDANSDEEDLVAPVRIGAVVARDESDEMVGFGRVLTTETPGDEALPNELMEAPVTLDEGGECLEEPTQAPYTSLGGPGGRVYVELIDRHDLQLTVSDEWRLQFFAAGPECPIGSDTEDTEEEEGETIDEYFGEYRVSVCDTEVDAPLPDVETCELQWDGPYANFADLEVNFSP